MAPTLQKLGHKAEELIRCGFQRSIFRVLRKEATLVVHAHWLKDRLLRSLSPLCILWPLMPFRWVYRRDSSPIRS